MSYNNQAIILKNVVDQARADQEAIKFTFYTIDNSEGARIMMESTKSRSFYRARYLNPDALATRNAVFKSRGHN